MIPPAAPCPLLTTQFSTDASQTVNVSIADARPAIPPAAPVEMPEALSAALSARLLLSETIFMPEILAFSIVIYLLASAAASPSQHAPIIPPALDRREEIYSGR